MPRDPKANIITGHNERVTVHPTYIFRLLEYFVDFIIVDSIIIITIIIIGLLTNITIGFSIGNTSF